MYRLFKELGIRGLAIQEALPLGAALIIAELFYKFHSFTLEAVAFLVTWFILGAVAAAARQLLVRGLDERGS